MPISKRTISFKPESDVKIALIEVESLAEILEIPIRLDEIINAALKSYLPPFLKALRDSLSMREKELLLSTLHSARHYLETGDVREDRFEDFPDEDAEEALFRDKERFPENQEESLENESGEEEEKEENTVNPDLLKKISF